MPGVAVPVRSATASCAITGRHTPQGCPKSSEAPGSGSETRRATHVHTRDSRHHDLVASKKFYDAVLGAIGVPEGKADPKGRIFYRTKTGVFGITKPIDGNTATHANGGTIGFACASPEQARAFHDAGVA